jgi:hypothetical protein
MEGAEDMPVEDMSLEDKLKALKNHKWQDHVEEGGFLDCMDTIQSWCLSQIETYNTKAY